MKCWVVSHAVKERSFWCLMYYLCPSGKSESKRRRAAARSDENHKNMPGQKSGENLGKNPCKIWHFDTVCLPGFSLWSMYQIISNFILVDFESPFDPGAHQGVSSFDVTSDKRWRQMIAPRTWVPRSCHYIDRVRSIATVQQY